MVAFHEGFALVMHGDVKVSVMHGDVNGRYMFQQKLVACLWAPFWWNFLKLQPMPCLGIVRLIYPWKVLQAPAASLVQKTSDIGASGYPKSQRLGSTGQDVILKVKQVRNHTFPKCEMEPKKNDIKREKHLPNLHLQVPWYLSTASTKNDITPWLTRAQGTGQTSTPVALIVLATRFHQPQQFCVPTAQMPWRTAFSFWIQRKGRSKLRNFHQLYFCLLLSHSRY